jgi:hypothetical protein
MQALTARFALYYQLPHLTGSACSVLDSPVSQRFKLSLLPAAHVSICSPFAPHLTGSDKLSAIKNITWLAAPFSLCILCPPHLIRTACSPQRCLLSRTAQQAAKLSPQQHLLLQALPLLLLLLLLLGLLLGVLKHWCCGHCWCCNLLQLLLLLLLLVWLRLALAVGPMS